MGIRVTGGAGFIGRWVVKKMLTMENDDIVYSGYNTTDLNISNYF